MIKETYTQEDYDYSQFPEWPVVDNVVVIKLKHETAKVFMRKVVKSINRAMFHAYRCGQEGMVLQSVSTELKNTEFRIKLHKLPVVDDTSQFVFINEGEPIPGMDKISDDLRAQKRQD